MSSVAGLEPLSPRRKWRAITMATLLLVPAYWSLLAGLVADASDSADPEGFNTAIALTFGLGLIPFVFVALAFLSEQPRAASTSVKAMGWALLVGIPASAIAGDAVSGIVAGVGAGGIVALRADAPHDWRARAVAVAIATAYTFVLVRTVGAAALLPAPIFPFTGLGVADHVSEWRQERIRQSAA